MLNHLVLAEVKKMLCLAILFLSAAQFFFLLFLLKHFAWDAISSMMQKREEKKSPMIWIQRNNPA